MLTTRQILQEDHYYPFGLGIAALSSTAPLSKPNRYKFNGGTEFNSDFDLGWYETTHRGLDVTLGRFMQIDPMADILSSINPYNFGYNNPSCSTTQAV
jgi:RHS repeat-associated protein